MSTNSEEAPQRKRRIPRLPACGPHLEQPEVCEVWFWDGDFDHVLGCIAGQEEKWLVERGILRREDSEFSGVKDLVLGDIVYRIRTLAAMEMGKDPREVLFEWFWRDVTTGREVPAPKEERGAHDQVEYE